MKPGQSILHKNDSRGITNEAEEIIHTKALNLKYGVLLLIIFVSFGAYLNTISHDFVYDDKSEIIENPWIKDIKFIPDIFLSHSWGYKFTDTTSSHYHPLRFIIHMLQYHLFETKPWGYHLTNVFIHTINTVLVFFISTSLFRQGFNKESTVFPAVASLLFAVHPVHSEAVAWVSAMGELWMSFFYLTAFFIYINTSQESLKGYIISAVFFFIAALFKATAITLPLLLVIYDYSFRKRILACTSRNAENDLFRRYMPFIIAAIIYLSLRAYAIKGFIPEEGYSGFNTYMIIINVFPLLSKYLEMLVIPLNLKAIYVFNPIFSLFDWKSLTALGTTVLFISCIFFARRKNIGLFFSFLWIIVPLLPVLYFPAFTGETVFAERYLYLPSVGFVMAAAILMKDIYYHRSLKVLTVPALFLSFATVAVLFALWTVNRNYVWKNDFNLWTDTLKKSPYSSIAHNNLGNAYYRKGLLDNAIREYQIALSLNPNYKDAFNNLSVVYTIRNAIKPSNK